MTCIDLKVMLPMSLDFLYHMLQVCWGFPSGKHVCQCGCQAQTEGGVSNACQAIGLITVTILARMQINPLVVT